MTCQRCDGLMVRERYDDLELGSAGYEISGWRCLNCGAITDSAIATNRRQVYTCSAKSQRHGEATGGVTTA